MPYKITAVSFILPRNGYNSQKYLAKYQRVYPLGDVSGIARIYLVTGKTDMRRSIDGLMAIIRDTYQMDPYANALYLFCGKRCNTIKALYFDKDGFCLIYKRLDSEGRFQWPRNAAEVRAITRQEFRWLMEGLSIEQPKAIRPAAKNSNKVF